MEVSALLNREPEVIFGYSIFHEVELPESTTGGEVITEVSAN